MDRHQVADILDETALLLEAQGENPIRWRAYSKAGSVPRCRETVHDPAALRARR